MMTAYPSISIRDQTELHDFLKQDVGRKKSLCEELNTVWTQTLIVQRNFDFGSRRLLPDSVFLHTLFLNLKEKRGIMLLVEKLLK